MPRALIILFYVVTVGVAIVSLVFLLPAYHQRNEMKARVAELELELAERDRESAEMRQFLHDLQHNPRAVEKVAREKFGLCREGEVIFQFQDDDLPPSVPAQD
jgi:cell division protein FtsB